MFKSILSEFSYQTDQILKRQNKMSEKHITERHRRKIIALLYPVTRKRGNASCGRCI